MASLHFGLFPDPVIDNDKENHHGPNSAGHHRRQYLGSEAGIEQFTWMNHK
jgi:hypothetical protein